MVVFCQIMFVEESKESTCVCCVLDALSDYQDEARTCLPALAAVGKAKEALSSHRA